MRAGGLVLLSGVTGVDSDGAFSSDPATQFHDAFAFLRLHLRAAGLDFANLAEITTYHAGLREHLPIFASVKDTYVIRPYPAWTAIGVTELITPGAILEIRAVANDLRHRSTDGEGR